MENNWSIAQTQKLFGYVRTAHENNRGLVWAFSKVGEETGRSVNSVRNYYYSQLKMFELVPTLATELGIKIINTQRGEFELFSEKEIRSLIAEILKAKADGVSVRTTITALSGGDKKKALRLQNKYRSMVASHKDRVQAVMNELSLNGTPYFNPYTKQVVTKDSSPDNYKKLSDYIATLDEKDVDNFFMLMKKLFA